jgi:hypothetical protein
MGIELLSKVPNKIKNSVGFSAFKIDLKSFLLKHPFYMINEFVTFNKKVDGASAYAWMS